MFVGTYERALDGKGRLVLPSQFRNQLAGHGYLAKYQGCLGLWTPDAFAEVAARLRQKVADGQAHQDAVRTLTSEAAVVEPDTQGRILVPTELRQFAALDRDVAVVGADTRIELWDSQRWGERKAQADESYIETLTNLGI